MVTKHLVAFATGTVVLAGAGWDLWSFHREDHVRVTTAAVTSGAIVRRIVATGTLQTVRTVQVGSQVSGTIQSLRADYNSIVHKGDVLATLDPAEYTAELRQAEAALAQAEANLLGFDVQIEDAQTKLTRAEQLAARQLIAPSDLDAARIALAQANADRSGGVAQVNEAQAEVVQAKVT
jgi:HlyD family secretion protein